jgi:hypothetical protein
MQRPERGFSCHQEKHTSATGKHPSPVHLGPPAHHFWGAAARKVTIKEPEVETKSIKNTEGEQTRLPVVETIVEEEKDEELENIIDMFGQYKSMAKDDTDLADALAQVKAQNTVDEKRGMCLDEKVTLPPKPLHDKVVARMAKCAAKWLRPEEPAWNITTPKIKQKWDTGMRNDLAKLANASPVYPSNRTICPDSGATSIMNPYRDMYLDYTDIQHMRQCVRLGDENKKIMIHGVGTMVLRVDGKTVAHENTLHVP